MNKTLESVVQDIGAGIPLSSGVRKRAEAVYDWISKHLEYDHERGKAILAGLEKKEVLNPTTVLERGKGSCGDLAFLYVSLAKMLGVNAHYARVYKDEQGSPVSHACAVVDLPAEQLQVDPTLKHFEAKHREYQIVDTGATAQATIAALRQEMRTPLLSAIFGRLRRVATGAVAFGLCAASYLGLSSCREWYQQRNLEHTSLSREERFNTQNGELKFTIEPAAEQPWKETLFFVEAKKGNLNEHELLEAYIRADTNNDDCISEKEAHDARGFVRATYLKQKR